MLFVKLFSFLSLICLTLGCTTNPMSQQLHQWKATGHYLEVKGYSLFVRDINPSAEKTMVLIHGFPTSSWDWHKLERSLMSNYRVVMVDMLGFGFSEKPQHLNYSIDLQTDLIESLLKKLSIQNAHFITHDYGTFVIEELLSRQNENTHKVSLTTATILNGPLVPEAINLQWIQKLLASPIGNIASKFTNQYLFTKNFTPIFGASTQPSATELNDFWQLITHNQGHRKAHLLMHYYQESHQKKQRWLNALKNTPVPTLYITGIADPVTGLDTAIQFKKAIPNADIRKLSDVGHYPHLESPSLVANAINTFVKRHD